MFLPALAALFPSIPFNPIPHCPVFKGLGLTLKLSSHNVDFWFSAPFWAGFAPVVCLYTEKRLILYHSCFKLSFTEGIGQILKSSCCNFLSLFLWKHQSSFCAGLWFYLHEIMSEKGIIWAGGNSELRCSAWYMKRIRKHKTDGLRNFLILPGSPSPQGFAQKKKGYFFKTGL